MHKNATKCNETLSKWCKNKHGASKIIDTFETYHHAWSATQALRRHAGQVCTRVLVSACPSLLWPQSSAISAMAGYTKLIDLIL
jgi:hypothetical protein